MHKRRKRLCQDHKIKHLITKCAYTYTKFLHIHTHLGVLAKLRKATISFTMSVCLLVRPSICLHRTTRFPIDEFS